MGFLKKMRTLRAFAALVLIAGLANCAEGRDYSYEESKTYLATHKDQLLRLVELVEACQPKYTTDWTYNAIRLNDPKGTAICADGSLEPVDDIKSAMRKAKVVILDVWLDEHNSAERAKFFLYVYGLSVSGVSLAIIYYPEEPPASEEEFPEGYELRPLDEAPHNGFWERWAT